MALALISDAGKSMVQNVQYLSRSDMVAVDGLRMRLRRQTMARLKDTRKGVVGGWRDRKSQEAQGL